MGDYLAHLRLAKGSHIKARRTYVRERRWDEEQWYSAWHEWLRDEVESASSTMRSGQ